MSFMMSDPGGRYRKRAAEGRRRAFFFLLVVAALFSFAYWRGAESVRSRDAADVRQARKLESERGEIENLITSLRADVQSLELRYRQLEERYKADVPSGALRGIMQLVDRQLKNGIRSERLTLAIESARPPKNCSAPVTKRFVVRTPAYNGPNTGASFWNGAVRVTADGAESVSMSGEKEAWYDPGKPVSIRFFQAGDVETAREGLLPIHHALVMNNKEYRFTIAAGERSFISVVSDVCDYP